MGAYYFRKLIAVATLHFSLADARLGAVRNWDEFDYAKRNMRKTNYLQDNDKGMWRIN